MWGGMSLEYNCLNRFPFYLYIYLLPLVVIPSFPLLCSALEADITTFSGEVSQVCAFHGLDDFALNYRSVSNDFNAYEAFEISSNLSSVRLSIASVSANNVPVNVPNLRIGLYFQHDSGSGYRQISSVARLSSTSVTSSPVEMLPGQNSLIRLRAYVDTSTRDNVEGGGYRYHLRPGDYSFTAVLNCLVE